MAQVKTIYMCQSCGYQTQKWLGRCPDCQNWNAFVEERISTLKTRATDVPSMYQLPPQPITSLDLDGEKRVLTGIEELDRALGGGMVPGSVILIGGDPGIGKSTLLLQSLNAIAEKGRNILYVSGEESPQQTKMRGDRIGAASENLLVYTENSLEAIVEAVEDLNPEVLAIDSVQTIASSQLESPAGSISQVRDCAANLVRLAKSKKIATFLVGHVTKDGSIAGPKVLEHMVDTVLYFEGDRGHAYRILRTVKNRFGSTNEIGVFEMNDRGLKEVKNPSCLFIAERPIDVSGTVVVSSVEGTRPLLVEIQSLIAPNPFGIPRRTVLGVDQNKVSLLVAVLEKKAQLKLVNHDIFLKVGGGLRLNEPAVDLGIVASIASNFLDKPVDSETIFFGEVGLTGEIRGTSYAEVRAKEARKLGFKRCILPKENEKALKGLSGIEMQGVSMVKDVMRILF